MSTTTHDTSENSVSFSLAQLAQIEEERVREEDAQRARAREREARERQEAEARRRAAEAAKIAAEAEERARREREEAAERALLEARERAAIEVARIEAEAKVRLEADNAARAHELVVLRARAEAGRRLRERVLAAVLGLALCGGGAAGYAVTRHMAALEQEAAELREGQRSQARERDHARAAELAALDRRLAALRARPIARDAEEARATAEAARSAINANSLDHDRLRAFADALDGLEAQLGTLEKVTALDRRKDDLTTWATSLRRSEATAAARAAAARAKVASADEGALHAYERALDQLRDALAQSGTATGRPSTGGPAIVRRPCAPGDPGCGLNGESVF